MTTVEAPVAVPVFNVVLKVVDADVVIQRAAQVATVALLLNHQVQAHQAGTASPTAKVFDSPSLMSASVVVLAWTSCGSEGAKLAEFEQMMPLQ